MVSEVLPRPTIWSFITGSPPLPVRHFSPPGAWNPVKPMPYVFRWTMRALECMRHLGLVTEGVGDMLWQPFFHVLLHGLNNCRRALIRCPVIFSSWHGVAFLYADSWSGTKEGKEIHRPAPQRVSDVSSGG